MCTQNLDGIGQLVQLPRAMTIGRPQRVTSRDLWGQLWHCHLNKVGLPSICYIITFGHLRPPSALNLQLYVWAIEMGAFLGTPSPKIMCQKDRRDVKECAHKIWVGSVNWWSFQEQWKLGDLREWPSVTSEVSPDHATSTRYCFQVYLMLSWLVIWDLLLP